ncbi:MAG: rod shape-determining protein RodA [Pseudomonadota bacterium]|nr:MAG: rod shape-determining protein RodA [Pseudomonadota bacterium]
MKRSLPTCLVMAILLLTGSQLLYAGETPSVEGTRVYFINLKDGDQVQSPFLVQLGLTEQMGLAPAAADWPDTGHHHLVIDTPTPNPNKSIPKGKNYIHLNMGQSEITIELSPR